MSETEVTVRGHLGHNPELQKSAAGKSWLRLRVATNRRLRTAEGWANGPTSWYEVRVFGAFAQNVAESLRKGDRVVVQGPLDIDEYVDDKGLPHRTAIIRANALGPDLSGATARVAKVYRNEAGEIVQPPAPEPPVDVSGMHEVDESFPDEEELEDFEDGDEVESEEIAEGALATV
ncbi:single-stranded DNA-binding protein [Pseudactinotalea terrae]|uniref:single-stranded DNA-binding protein n=1 Tax=Pseudactinotalea terrae TaxID=1743262 RepID=UPI0012E0FB13|nr:single-stranded DNA-binding protein [Pseudactinotalea terrae]